MRADHFPKPCGARLPSREGTYFRFPAPGYLCDERVQVSSLCEGFCNLIQPRGYFLRQLVYEGLSSNRQPFTWFDPDELERRPGTGVLGLAICFDHRSSRSMIGTKDRISHLFRYRTSDAF